MSGKPYTNVLIHQTIRKLQQYWVELREQIHAPDNASEIEAKWLAQEPYFKQLSFHNSVAIVIWNIVTNRFILAVDERNIMKHDLDLFVQEKGVELSLQNFYPDHIHAIQLINQCINTHLLEHKHLPSDKLIGNINALYKNGQGDYIQLLQQIVPVEKDEHGYPILYLSYVRDITHLKKYDTAAFVFTSPEGNKFYKYNVNNRMLEPVMPFTAQERRVIELLSEGKQTRQIAELLSLSPHTIDTHRRNMLAKTSCLDTTALIVYCQLIGII